MNKLYKFTDKIIRIRVKCIVLIFAECGPDATSSPGFAESIGSPYITDCVEGEPFQSTSVFHVRVPLCYKVSQLVTPCDCLLYLRSWMTVCSRNWSCVTMDMVTLQTPTEAVNHKTIVSTDFVTFERRNNCTLTSRPDAEQEGDFSLICT
jgi:hypothetical protein